MQLNEAAAVPVVFAALYGDAMTLSPSSSSETAVVKLMRSSSEICKDKEQLLLIQVYKRDMRNIKYCHIDTFKCYLHDMSSKRITCASISPTLIFIKSLGLKCLFDKCMRRADYSLLK